MRLSHCSVLCALCLPVAAQQDAALFDAPMLVFDPSSSVQTVADLDGDGDVDALGWWWRYYSPGPVALRGYRNDGHGRFSRMFDFDILASASTYVYWALDRGNFNGDQRQDFVAWFDSTVSVYTMSAAGTPVLYWRTTLPIVGTPATPEALGVADFDGDGLDDLALCTDVVRVFRNTGSGFQDFGELAGALGKLHVIDLDGDGRPDLVKQVASNHLQPIYVGAAGLVAGASIALGLPGADEGMTSCGDIDGDGDVDIVSFNMRGEYVVARRTGPATFQVEPLAVGGPATGLADIDGDGDLDGVCCGGGQTPHYNSYPSLHELSLNDGTGRFAPAIGIPSVGSQRLAGAVDLDGDGDVDLIAGRGIYFNRGTFARPPQPVHGIPRLDSVVQPRDLDGDGDLDLSWGSSVYPTAQYRNDGAGTWEGFASRLPDVPPGDTLWGPGWRGDFTGDGVDDLIVGYFRNAVFQGMRLLVGRANGDMIDGGFAAAGQNFNAGGYEYSFGPSGLVADLDGDGDLDLATANADALWLNQGDGHFVRGAGFVWGAPGGCADFDGDGHPDLLTCSASFIHVHFGNGDGTFLPPLSFTATNGSVDGLALGDFDHDGDLDFVAGDDGHYVVMRYENLGGRQFAYRFETQLLYHPNSPRRVQTADVDGDGWLDLLYWPPLGAYTGLGVSFGSAQGFGSPRQFAIEPRAVGDIDGDGDLDVLTAERAVPGMRFHGAEAGSRRQFGIAGRGAGGYAPVLGATGPFRGGEQVVLRLAGAPGGTLASLVFALSAQETPNWPLRGMIAYAYPMALALPFPTTGGFGDPGTGTLRVPFTASPEVAGYTFYHQVHVYDPSLPVQLNYTGGLELRYGR